MRVCRVLRRQQGHADEYGGIGRADSGRDRCSPVAEHRCHHRGRAGGIGRSRLVSAAVQLACRFQASGTGADRYIYVLASGYSDAATAINETAFLRTAAQGVTFTKVEGIADEAYAFVAATQTGMIARKGRSSVWVGVSKLLGVPRPAEFTPIIQALLAKVGS
jgi:hypothetical protein